MANQRGWHEGNRPEQDGSYLVRITPQDGLQLGMGTHPPILVASYKTKDKSWVAHGTIIPDPEFGENVISLA